MAVDDSQTQPPQQQQQQQQQASTNGVSTTSTTATTATQGANTPVSSSPSSSPSMSKAASAFGAAAAAAGASSDRGSSQSTASSRFRALAMNAARASAARNSPGASNGTTATAASASASAEKSATNGAAASSFANTSPPTGPLPPPPPNGDKNGGASDAPPPPRTEMTSKMIYNIAKTKMLAHRTVIRLSSETGFIKLRSKPPAGTKPSGQSAVTNGTTTGGSTKDKEVAGGEAAKDVPNEYKAVAGWKEKGAIDSGKQSAPGAEPSFMDTIAPYIEMVDQTGMWRNCAGVFGLMFLTYVLTSLRMGILGLGLAMAYGAQWYRNSIERYRRTVRDDLERAYEKSTITRTLESVGWLNEFVTRFWLMFEPSLSRMAIDIANPILAQNAPGFVDSVRLTTFTLGTKAPRIDGVRTYSELEDRNQIVMDWHASFTPNDLTDVPAVLRENRVNPKVVLTVRVGKGFIGAGMPILVEDMVFRGKMQVKLHLGPVFPHVRTADVCFLERPAIDFSLKPVGGDTFGFDIAHIPGLRTFILDILHGTLGPMFYAPNHFTVDVEQIISGA
ncbi:Tricalbin-2, partial [Coemansia sp. BCRC 34490]